MSDPTRVALLGYGFAGKTFHAPLIQATPGLELTVVGSTQPDRVHVDLPKAVVLGDAQEAITHSDVDLVVIATPNETHLPLALAALRAGRHVVVDKPFTNTLAEARQLVAEATERGRVLSVFQNRRWDSEFLAAKVLLASGRLGEVVQFEAHFDRYRPQVRQRWREAPGPGSGLWFDLGPHLVDQALQLFGLPQTVSASLKAQRPGAKTDDWAHVILDYGHRQVILHGSMLVASGSPRFTLHGTAGSWIKAASDPQEAQLIAGMRPGDAGWGHDPRPGLLYDGQSPEPMAIAAPDGDYGAYYRQLQQALTGAASNPVSPAQALAVMAVLVAAVDSSAHGQAMPLALSPAEQAAWAEG